MGALRQVPVPDMHYIVVKTKNLFLTHGHFRVYWESLATPPGPKFNSEHGKGVERTGRSDLMAWTPAYYCKGGQRVDEWTCCGCEMEMKRFPEFLDWVRSQSSLTSAFCHVKRWLLAIKVQTDSGSKSVQINQYNILWVLRSQSIFNRS